MTKFLSYVIANDKFIHHPGVRKPGPKMTDIKKIKEFAPEVSFLSLPPRGPAHHQMEEASAGAQGPENCCSSSPCRFFFSFSTDPILIENIRCWQHDPRKNYIGGL